MSIELEGDEWFPVPPAELFEKMTDFKFLIRCFPDVASVTSVEPDQLIFKVRPGFSFVKGTIENQVEWLEKVSPKKAVMRVKGRGIGSSVTVDTGIELADWLVTIESGQLVPGTKVHWKAQVHELGGLLKAVSRGLLEAAANKSISVAWSKFRKLLETG